MVAGGFDRTSVPPHHCRRESARRDAQPGTDGEHTVSVDLATELGRASTRLATRLADPALVHTIGDLEAITDGFATTVGGLAEGVTAMAAWMRTAGHGGTLSGHTSVVADRLAHAGDELDRLRQAVAQAASPEN
ncbi:hypothetical protein FHX42_002025 [Saccharopolyspora lacisalsi]|uniref:Uncharacterized protein n=1 Tax=Halosaccharopolyspora lacisalsi TaxID=1000566 RepID=A0A839E130_9PSEU|nr:hypothetical protein [Halosaccharopolyspora lacisalsi]MBA8824678.1 hypothetical protein [Halosaccharopolyspora lacisalsi]